MLFLRMVYLTPENDQNDLALDAGVHAKPCRWGPRGYPDIWDSLNDVLYMHDTIRHGTSVHDTWTT